jgi:hypothetical protein
VAKRGRPSDYNDAIAKQICTQIVEGISLRTICKQDGFPTLSTIFVWLTKHKEFQEQYALARELQAEIYADEIVELSDQPLIGTKVIKNKHVIKTKRGERRADEVIVGDNVERSKLQVDARKWVAVKLLRKKYGDEKDAGERKDRLNELEDVFRAGPVKTEER